MFRGNDFYGYDIHKRLQTEGVEVELSRLYRVLNDMLKEGLLDSRWEKSSSGPRKRMYQIGAMGKKELNKILLDSISTIHSFYGDYLLSIRSKVDVFGKILGFITDDLKGNENIAYVCNRFIGMDQMIVSQIYRKVPEGNVYLIKPSHVEADLILDKLSILDGDYDNIPLRSNHIDRLVSVSLPRKVSFEGSIKEWDRVVNSGGSVAILTPAILLQKYEDPLSIGDFVERYEHEFIEEGEHIEGDYVLNEIKQYFQDVAELNYVHITAILASRQ
jgi:DNA-binding PadR family transcriptional regulator